jgi:hypothetical protein
MSRCKVLYFGTNYSKKVIKLFRWLIQTSNINQLIDNNLYL